MGGGGSRLFGNFSQIFPFLAATSSSRNDNVTKCVFGFVVILFNLVQLKHLKQYVLKVLQGCLMGVSRCLKGVHRVL